MPTGKEQLAMIYRKRLKSSPYSNARKLHELTGLSDEDIEVVVKKLGWQKARYFLLTLGIDTDYVPGQDDGEWIEPRPPYQD